jgi:hypothetical protein
VSPQDVPLDDNKCTNPTDPYQIGYTSHQKVGSSLEHLRNPGMTLSVCVLDDNSTARAPACTTLAFSLITVTDICDDPMRHQRR